MTYGHGWTLDLPDATRFPEAAATASSAGRTFDGPDFDAARLHPAIRDFYERTAEIRSHNPWASIRIVYGRFTGEVCPGGVDVQGDADGEDRLPTGQAFCGDAWSNP